MSALRLYIGRHEEAEVGYGIPDSDRSLTQRGRFKARETGRWLVENEPTIDQLVTSPLVRAVQTSELYMSELMLDEPISAVRELAFPVSLARLKALLLEVPGNCAARMMVGHEPTVSSLCAYLMGVDSFPFAFRTGSITALEIDRSGNLPAQLRWFKSPENEPQQ